jgi:formylglycine-generating enzyme required for sulfatase activity
LASTLVACHLVIDTGDLEGGCPRRLAGPALVKVDSASGAYCIDSTEVTNAHYKAFIDSQVQVELPIGCEPVTGYAPNQMGWPLPGTDDAPVVQVNWCQAYAFCRWSGKRLCGNIRGGPLGKKYETDTSLSQWLNACTHGGANPYPYGNAFDPKICAGPSVPSPVYVKKFRGCEGGYPGLFDMSGNVWEWADTCDPAGTGNTVSCHAWGGAYNSIGDAEFRCDSTRNWVQVDGAGNIGFRCCKDL